MNPERVEPKTLEDFNAKEKLIAKQLIALLVQNPPAVSIFLIDAVAIPGFRGEEDWYCGEEGNILIWGDMSKEAINVLVAFLNAEVVEPWVISEDKALELCSKYGINITVPILRVEDFNQLINRTSSEAREGPQWLPISLSLLKLPEGFGITLH